MKLFKTLCLSAMLVLLAGTTLGASRDVHPGLIMPAAGVEPTVLFQYTHVQLSTTDNCLSSTAYTDDACANYDLNTITTHRAMKVTNLAVTVDVSANAASTCDLFMEIDGSTAGVEMTAFSAVTIGTTTHQAQNLVVPAGSGFSINITDASGCYDTTAPAVTVWVEGVWLY
jgi:hypothetical protein